MNKVIYNGVTYRVGDKVLLVNKRPFGWNSQGEMDCFLGKIITISKFYDGQNFQAKESKRWMFGLNDVVKKVEANKHFKSYPDNYTGILNIKDGYVIEPKQEKILDEEEKKYLENVIRPFKDKVSYIEKSEFNNVEYISIDIKEDACIGLPNFPKDTMYKGMKTKKKYTLKELGLFEE